MLRDVFLAQPEEPGGIVVEDVALLLLAQERRLLDGLDGDVNGPGPDHLVGSPHDPLPEASLDKPLEMTVELRAGVQPVVAGDVDVQVGMGEQHRDHLVHQRRAVVHGIHPQPLVSDEDVLQQKRAPQPHAISRGPQDVDAAGRTLSHVYPDRDVQLLGQREIGFVCLVVHPEALVLRSDLGEDRDLALGDQATQLVRRAVLAAEGESRDDSVGGGRSPYADLIWRARGDGPDVVPLEPGQRLLHESLVARRSRQPEWTRRDAIERDRLPGVDAWILDVPRVSAVRHCDAEVAQR